MKHKDAVDPLTCLVKILEEAVLRSTHRPLSSSFLGIIPYRILNINQKEGTT